MRYGIQNLKVVTQFLSQNLKVQILIFHLVKKLLKYGQIFQKEHEKTTISLSVFI